MYMTYCTCLPATAPGATQWWWSESAGQCWKSGLGAAYYMSHPGKLVQLSGHFVTKTFGNLNWHSETILGPLTAVLDVLDATLFMPNEILKRFIKKFFKIDKKFVSQSILEVGHSTSRKKVMFFTNLDFCIGFPIVKLMHFDDYR